MPPSLHARLHDLRLLYLAHEVEAAFEGLERALHRHLPSGHVQDTLRPLFEGGPSHRRLEEALRSLNREMAERQADVAPLELLRALRDCERMAHDFYVRHAGELSDPKLAELFRGLAQEEAGHLRAVEQAIALQQDIGA